jgi:hypothetical protein
MVNVVYNGNYNLDYDFEKQNNLTFTIKKWELTFKNYDELKRPILHSIINFIKYCPTTYLSKYVMINKIIKNQNNPTNFFIDITEFDDLPLDILQDQFTIFKPLTTNDIFLSDYNDDNEIYKISPKSLVYVK